MNSCKIIIIGSLLAVAGSCFAQGAPLPPDKTDRLVNMDTPYVPPNGTVDGSLQLRAFRGSEGLAYGTFELNGGLGHGLGVILRGTFANTSTFNGSGFKIRHGGSDFEAMIKFAVPELPNVAVELGVALPNTPAQKKAFGTGQVVYEYYAAPVRLYAGARAVTSNNATLAGLCGGISVEVGRGFDLFGDATWVVGGQNTYSTSTGALQQGSIYGFGARYSPPGEGRNRFSIEAGATNALGGTTGMSLTPSLGSNVGFFAALQVRF